MILIDDTGRHELSATERLRLHLAMEHEPNADDALDLPMAATPPSPPLGAHDAQAVAAANTHTRDAGRLGAGAAEALLSAA